MRQNKLCVALLMMACAIGAIGCFGFMIWWFDPMGSHTAPGFAPGRGFLQGIPLCLGIACCKGAIFYWHRLVM
jgi:hypothetical protein